MFSVTLSKDHLRVEPGSAATLTVSVKNNGTDADRVEINLSGLDNDWVAVPVPSFMLEPGVERAEKILIKPPRTAESKAGAYPFAVSVKSLETGAVTDAPSVLDVEAFHLISIEIEPKRGIAGFLRKEAPFGVTAINLGNSAQNLQMFADDPEDGCTYRFDQERVQLSPGQQREVGLSVQPVRVPMVGSAELYGFTVTARSVENPLVVANASGQVERRTMLTPALLLAVLATVALAGYWIAARPKPAQMDSLDADATEVLAGKTVTLSWAATNAKSVTIETQDGPFLQGLKPTGSTTVPLNKTTTYYAYAVNEMGRSRAPRQLTVVARIEPQPQPAFIASFTVSRRNVNVGDTVTVNYKVSNATKVQLQPLGVDLPVKGLDSYDFIAEQPGNMTLKLTAYNVKNEAVSRTQTISVRDVSTAKILVFKALLNGEALGSREVDVGTLVGIEWHVSNAEIVRVEPDIGIGTSQGALSFVPEKTAQYKLTAIDSSGRPAVSRITIKVKKPAPAPTEPPPMGPPG